MSFKKTKNYLEKLFKSSWTDTPIHYGGEEFNAKQIDSWVNIVYQPSTLENKGFGTSKVSHSIFTVVCWGKNDAQSLDVSDKIIAFMEDNLDPNTLKIRSTNIVDHGWQESNSVFTIISFRLEGYVGVCYGCERSVGGKDGTEYNLQGYWMSDCSMFFRGIPKVQIRYTSTDDLTTLDSYAIGGTAQITDNGDGTYDLWSYDDCEFVALSDYYYNDVYYMNITKIEIIKGDTLKYFYYNDGEDINASTVGGLSSVNEIILNTLLKPNSTEMMFGYSGSITSLDLSNLDTSSVTTMEEMFSDCTSLTSLDASSFDISNVMDITRIFQSCTSLEYINLTGWSLPAIETKALFSGCTALKCITNLDTTNSTSKVEMFNNCISLVQPDGWNADYSLYTGACLDLTDVDGADWVNPNACPDI